MADPLSISSGLLAIIGAAAKATTTLYQTVRSFNNHQRAVKQLSTELESLEIVLESLLTLAVQDASIIVPLKLPLSQCHRACIEFDALLTSCSKHSEGSRTSFRDWARLRYMDGDVIEFTNMLAGYKSTISIALADANLRSTTVTLQVLNEYKDMIQSTSQDLEDHLREINDKLEALATRSISHSTPTLEQQRMKDERDSTEQCLGICEEVLSHINSMRLLPLSDDPLQPSMRTVLKGRSLEELDRSHLITLSALAECSDKLVDTVTQLKARNRDARHRLQNDYSPTPATANDTAEEARKLEEERLSAEQCLAICAQASGNASSNRIHTLEDVTMGDNGQQIFVSTLGDLFNLKGVSAGDGAIQFVGSVSDSTLQHYFLYQQHQ